MTVQLQPVAPVTPPSLLARAHQQVRQFVCGLRSGHDALLHFEPGRLSLQCQSCGYESPGWDCRGGEPYRAPAKAPRRVIRLPLVGQRRVC